MNSDSYDSYIYVIVALLPLSALMLTVQVNPYNALVIRGILGGVAALVYAVLGAADVALTEALVGTMLAITLYAVAVRSSMVMQIGVLKDKGSDEGNHADDSHPFTLLIADLRTIANKYHLRLELLPYPDAQSLQQALMEKEIHLTCVPHSCMERSPQVNLPTLSEVVPEPDHIAIDQTVTTYYTVTRIRRLYEIFQTELISPVTSLTYVKVPDLGEKH